MLRLAAVTAMQQARGRLLVKGLHRTGKSYTMKGRLQAVGKRPGSCLSRTGR